MSNLVNVDLAFIHIPKCGGHSIQKYLEMTCAGCHATNYRHINVNTMIRSEINIAKLPMILAVVRNPFSREVSQWQFWREEYDRGKTGEYFDNAHKYDFKDWVKTPESNFACKENYGKGFYYWWINANDTLPPNLKLVRLETIETDLPEMTKEFRLLDAPIKKLNTSKSLDYRTFYDDKTVDEVIKKYNFTFETKLYGREI